MLPHGSGFERSNCTPANGKNPVKTLLLREEWRTTFRVSDIRPADTGRLGLFQRPQLALLQFLVLQARIVPSWAQVPGLQ
jgi:hypothetical protein